MSASELIRAAVREVTQPPKISPQTALTWMLLYPILGSLTVPLERPSATLSVHFLILLVYLGQFIRLWARHARKAITAVPRSERARTEAAFCKVATAARNGTVSYALLFVAPHFGALCTLLSLAALVFREMSKFSSMARAIASFFGMPTPSTSSSSSAESPSSSSAAPREKPAKHRTARYEVVDEGPHFGRVARGALLQG